MEWKFFAALFQAWHFVYILKIQIFIKREDEVLK